MRTITIQRERALACFALRYYVYVGEDEKTFTEEMNALENPMAQGRKSPFSLTNGGSIRIEADDRATTLIAAILTEKKTYISNSFDVPEGDEDLSFIIRTVYHPNKSMGIVIEQL